MGLKLKAAILLEDFNKVSMLLFQNEELAKNLNDNEFNILVSYAIRNNKKTLLNMLLKSANEAQRNKIFDYIFYMEGRIYKLSNIEYVSYFNDIMKLLIADNNIKLIYDIAKSVNAAAEDEVDTSVLKDFLMNREVDDLTVDIGALPLYKSPELEEKILEGKAIYIAEYIVNLKEKKEFLKKIFKRDNIKEIILELAKEAKIDKEFYPLVLHSILKYTSNNPLKSEYLYILFLETSSVYHHEYLVEQILLLNDFKTIKELMPKLCSDEQAKYSKRAIEEQNIDLILTLACSTNTCITDELINIIIDEDDFNKITFMVGNLKGEYLYKALEAILYQKKASYYLKLIDNLYIYGLNNWLSAINFIFVNKLEKLFDVAVLAALCHFKKDKKKEMARNRKK